MVYSENAAIDAIANFKKYTIQTNIPQWNTAGTAHPEEMVLITQNFKELQQIMTNYVGIVRSKLRLKRAMDRLQIIYNETEELYAKTTLSTQLCELRNCLNAAYLVIKSAQARQESVGLHFITSNSLPQKPF
jgi:L-aspartate oxidase